MECVKEFRVRGRPETKHSEIFGNGASDPCQCSFCFDLLSLSEDRLPLFLDACGRILLPEVPKFFVYCHAGPKRETAIYKFPDSQEVYWLSLFES